MLPITKIYIDTRQRTVDSASHSDFSIDPPTTFLMPDDTGFYVEDICLPISWWTIEAGVNDTLFWGQPISGTTQVPQTVSAITVGTYTSDEPGIAIVKEMNGQFAPTAPRFASEYRKAQNAIVIKWLDSYIGSNVTAFLGFIQIATQLAELQWVCTPPLTSHGLSTTYSKTTLLV